jgi:hypothetical protein
MPSIAIPVYGLEWHLHKSPAQNLVLIDPLRPYMDFELHGWDGMNLNISSQSVERSPIVFFQNPPPKNLMSNPHAQIVWIPMWDQVWNLPPRWWDSLPENVRVISFSKKIDALTVPRGIKTLSLRFYKNPQDLLPVSWSGERILYYWNRTGLVSRVFLERICQALRVDTLIFRSQLDPYISKRLYFSLPSKIGNTKVETLPEIELLTREAYAQLTSRANIILAPRALEGVGLVLLESLARGCAAFAFDAPTMNEYITHGVDGYLIGSYSFSLPTLPSYLARQAVAPMRKFWGKIKQQRYRDYKITEWQDWGTIRQANLPKLGETALQHQSEGYVAWKNNIEKYASFILDW